MRLGVSVIRTHHGEMRHAEKGRYVVRVVRSRLLCAAVALIGGVIVGAWLHGLGVIPFHRVARVAAGAEPRAARAAVRAGHWGPARGPRGGKRVTEEQARAMQQLQGLGYLAGSRRAPKVSGVTIDDEAKAYSGLNLVVSGHGPEAVLMDMTGRVRHRWGCDVFHAWPGFKVKGHSGPEQFHTYWRRARVMPNGDLLAIFDYTGLIKLDKRSRLIWATRNAAHHDLDVARNGDIYVLTGTMHINKTYNAKEPIWEDYITVLDAQGHELRRVSVLEALQNSDFAAVLNRAASGGDILHTNTVELIEGLPGGRATPFRNGTVLIAIRDLDLVCAVDLNERRAYWAESALWHREHQPTLLDNGNVLVLDNERTKSSSAVVEFDPLSRQVKWSYLGGRDGRFFTATCGSCQRLPNGNTLITESDAGRAFEVTPNKRIVWEYVNPQRAGERRELIATLFEVVRLPKQFPVAWLR
jgi:hypothetical protein